MALVYIIMGVSGSGKTTVGKMLAEALQIPFYDADDFHPETNIKKMATGVALNDSDRWPWLDVLASKIDVWSENRGAVLACSALKEVYRKRLFKNDNAFAKAKSNFIYLHAEKHLINERLARRENHFFDSSLVNSQFEALEPPSYGKRLDAATSKEMILTRILQHIRS